MKGGIIIGGGKSLYNARKVLDIEQKGDFIVYKSLTAPLQTLVENAGISIDRYDALLDDNKDMGINMVTGDSCDLREAGIFDPVLVTIGSFDAAMSIANLFLTTDVAVLMGE